MVKYIFLVMLAHCSFAQNNLTVEYGADYLEYYVHEKDTIGLPEAAKSQLAQNEKFKKSVLEGNHTVFVLAINSDISSFNFKDFMEVDDGASFATLFIAARMTPLFKINNELFLVKDLLKEKRTYKKHNQTIDWEIKDEYREILGFNCQLAETEVLSITNRKFKVKAWFAKEIPIPEGPSFYKGLPGLILGLEKHGRYIYAKNIEFPEELNIEIPENLSAQLKDQ